MISSYPQSYVQQSQVGGRSFPPSLAAGLGHGHGGHHNPNASPGPAADGGLYDGSLPGYTAAAVAAAAAASAAAGSHQTALARVRVSPFIFGRCWIDPLLVVENKSGIDGGERG